MKLLPLLATSALAVGAVGSNIVQALEELNREAEMLKRKVDAASDPTRYSVLSVLATAVPPDARPLITAVPMAYTDANAPDWYKQLPNDVKSLLPELYPQVKAKEEVTTNAASGDGLADTITSTASSATSTSVDPIETATATTTMTSTSTATVTATITNGTMTNGTVLAPTNPHPTESPSHTGSHTGTGIRDISVNFFSTVLMIGVSALFCLFG
ncbi:hypothetical protein BU26DRAFT_222220 [Trematosphaeria pertusa]|uniref:Uncharacterized protein n=1 Tax=Trematosphaeria pertusa TaxID=390896 RepID=A0A6A6ISB7_9PLEO|nr:uncharacterized protein BU26DRAFT_222220 [Trematosphaeria pertusa]KAF2253404.1 hypothetical protein BU26DRAFT_222220 [Trematosphaeria pertusa]